MAYIWMQLRRKTLFEKILVKLPLLQFGSHVADVVCRLVFFILGLVVVISGGFWIAIF